MKQLLLIGLASLLPLGSMAMLPDKMPASLPTGSESLRLTKGTNPSSGIVKKLGGKVAMKTAAASSGRTIRKISKNDVTINPLMRKTPKMSGSENGMLLWESFEGCDPSVPGWLPEGWSVESYGDPNLEAAAKWGVDLASAGFFSPAAPDGEYYAGIGFSESGLPQDEWLILPSVKPEGLEELKFQLYSSPLFFYETYNEDYPVIDWDTMEWLVEPVKKGDVSVQARVGDGEWRQIWSMMDQFADYTLTELMYYDQFGTFAVSLSEFAGEEVQLAFNYKGVDANTVYLDCVSVGLPSLDGVSYTPPFETLYWGFDKSEGWSALNLSVAQYPVFGPLTFFNNWGADADYSWRYHDPITNDIEDYADPDMLEVTYLPDYSSEFTRRNNMYYPPVLNATAPGASPASYTMPVDYMQAGGKPEFELKDSEGNKVLMDFGLLPFNLNTDDYGVLMIDAPSIGDPSYPVFGYNENSDKYWLDYTMNGETPSEGDDVKMVAILNFIYAPTAPLVVTGVHVNALGKMSENAEFKMEIIACDEEYVPREEAIATAVCKYADMAKMETDLPYLMLNIPFVFDKPVVLDNSEVAYIAKLSGFNSDDVETFIPVQSIKPNESLCHGWIEKHIKVDSDVYRTSYAPMAYVEGQYGDCYNAFAINLDGWYPWLECEVNEVAVPSDGTPVEVRLGSYYDGAEYSLGSVAGLSAKVEGRYNECVLTLSHDDSAVVIDGNLEISAPGVKKVISVSEKKSGINTISDSQSAEPVGIYRVDGTKVKAGQPANGIYLVKYSDGTVRKVSVK